MAERDFQRALLHLYRKIEPDGGDLDFTPFCLSDRERGWLDELIVRDRQALTMFGDQLTGKRRTVIAGVLPIAREAFAEPLDQLLDRFVNAVRLEGTADPPALIRRFADFLDELEVSDTGEGRVLAFVRFEARLAAIAAAPLLDDCAPDALGNLGLRLGRNALIFSSDFDVVAGFDDPTRIPATPRLAEPMWLLLFADRPGNARALTIGAGLATLLRSAHDVGLDRALAMIGNDDDRACAGHSVARLLETGVPFVAERAHA